MGNKRFLFEVARVPGKNLGKVTIEMVYVERRGGAGFEPGPPE